MLQDNYSPFDFISPLDARYYGTEGDFFTCLHPFLSEEATINYQVLVERALLAELELEGIAPRGASASLAQALDDRPITPDEVYKEEQRIHHNIRALANCLRARLAPEVRGFVHLFATSNDIMDTARSLMLRDISREVLLPDLNDLMGVIVEVATKEANTPQVGRTHGRHAVPLTLGYWLANYVDRLGQRMEYLRNTAQNLRGMMSGAVGAHNSFSVQWPDDPAGFEERLLARLGLRPSENSISTQVVQAEYVSDFAHGIVSTFSVLANLADDYRNLMRSEIEEIGEDTHKYRVGSSTMPHKVNPKNFENVKSLWKAAVPRMITVYMDQLSEHQRDLTNSASGRFLSELIAVFAYAVRRSRKAIKGTLVNRDALGRNLDIGGQWTVAEPLYIALALSGQTDAYNISRELVKECRGKGVGLLDYLHTPQGSEVLDKISPEHQRIVLDPRQYLGDAPVRTILVCEDWWGNEAQPGRVNPIERLVHPLDRPSNEAAVEVSYSSIA